MALANGVPEDYKGHLTEQALVAAGVNDVQKTYEALEYMLKKFRSLECSACHEHFGYSLRQNPNIKFCSSLCLQRGQTGSVRSDQENEAVIEKSLGDIKEHVARLPLTPTSKKNLDVITNGVVKDSKPTVAEPVKKVEPVPSSKPKDDFKGSNTSLASGRSGSAVNGTGKDVTDLSSSTKSGTEANGAPVKKTNERKLFTPVAYKSSAIPCLPQRDLGPIDDSPPKIVVRVMNSTERSKGPEVKIFEKPADPRQVLPTPVMTRPRATPTVAQQPPQPKRLMVNEVPISSNLYNNQQVVIQFTYAPNKFTVSALADEARITEVQDAIGKYIKSGPPAKTDLIQDELVFAKYATDDGSQDYYRAVVTTVLGNNKYKVTFVDYGDAREVAASDCFEPCKNIMEKHHLYGIVFTLKGTADQGLGMPELESTGYGVFLEGEVFTLEIDSRDGINWTGDLYSTTTKTPLTKKLKECNEQVKPKAAPAAKAPEVTPAPVQAPVAPKSAPQPVAKTTEPISPPPTGDDSQKRAVQSRYALIKTNPFLKTDEVKAKPGKQQTGFSPNIKNGAKVQIGYIWSNTKVTLNAEEDLKKMHELGLVISKHLKPETKLKEIPEVGDTVIAPYEDSFYRGRVDCVEGDIITVTFIDYGATARVKTDQCHDVDEIIMQHPYYGRICKLKLIPEDLPDVTSPELDAAMLEYFTLETNNCQQPIWEVTLKLDETRSYNKLLLKAISA